MRRLLNRPKPPSPLHQRSRSISGVRLGFGKKYFAVEHYPHPLRRSTFERHFAAHPHELRDDIDHRLRSAAQFGPVALANHLEILAGQAHLAADDRLFCAMPAELTREQLAQQTAAAERNPRVAFTCLQSLGEDETALRDDVFEWLEHIVGDPARAASPSAANPA
jgi:hypothetical protein